MQVMGVDNYHKNAEVLREVEKVIKQDKDKLADFCKILQTIPTLKHIGDKIFQEIGCPVTTTPPLPARSPTAEQQSNTTIDITQDTMTELERLHNNFCELHFNAVKELRRFCEDKKDNLLDIATYATLLTSADVKLTDSTDINDLFGKLHPKYDFIDCDIVKDIITKFLPESTIVDDIVKHVKDTKKFIDSQPISILLEDLKKVRLHTQIDSDTHMAPITIKISRTWGEKHITNLRTLIDYLLPQPYPKMSLFKYITIEKSSIYIKYLVLQSYVEATISHAKQHLRFMSYIGIYNLVIDGTIVVQHEEDRDFSFDESLLKATSKGNPETVRFLLSIGANVNYQNPIHHEKEQYHVAKTSLLNTPLMIACQKGFYQLAQLLFHNNANPNIQNKNGCTALIFACHNGYYQIVELLLNNGANPDIQMEDGGTALMIACENGHYRIAEILLHKNTNPNIQMKDGWTVLMSASQNGQYQVVKLLLNNHTNPNIQNKNGCTALIFACHNGYYQIVELLLDNGANSDIQMEDGGTALMIACENGHYEIAELLLHKNTNPNIQMKDGWTVLMSASQNGQYQVVKLLLNNHTNPNIQSKNGCTALILACHHGHYQIAKLLLQKNADPNILMKDGSTALMIACHNGHYQVVKLLLDNNVDPNIKKKDGSTALMFACYNGHHQVAKLLLLELKYNVDPNIHMQDGYTALMSACEHGHYRTAKLLLHNNVDSNIQMKDGQTALMLACKNGHYQVAELLLNNNADLNIQTEDGWTALMFACQNGHHQVVELLLNHSAHSNNQADVININAQNTYGETALYIAYKRSYRPNKIVSILLDAGANPNILPKELKDWIFSNTLTSKNLLHIRWLHLT